MYKKSWEILLSLLILSSLYIYTYMSRRSSWDVLWHRSDRYSMRLGHMWTHTWHRPAWTGWIYRQNRRLATISLCAKWCRLIRSKAQHINLMAVVIFVFSIFAGIDVVVDGFLLLFGRRACEITNFCVSEQKKNKKNMTWKYKSSSVIEFGMRIKSFHDSLYLSTYEYMLYVLIAFPTLL